MPSGGGGSASALGRVDRWRFFAAKQLGSEAAKRNFIREFVKLFSLTKRKLFIFSPLGLCRVKTIDNCFARGLVEFVSELERTYKFKRGVQRHKNTDRATECAMTNIGANFLKIARHSVDNNILSPKNLLKALQEDLSLSAQDDEGVEMLEPSPAFVAFALAH